MNITEYLINICKPILSLRHGDKICHVLISFILMILFSLLTNIYYAFVITFAIGLYKEIQDIKVTKFDKYDILANTLGILLAGAIITLF